MYVVCIGGWVSVRDLCDLLSSEQCQLLLGAVQCNSLEVSVDHGIGVSLSALNCETTVEEPGVSEHFPYDWVSPIVWLHLWEYLDAEIVVASLENLRH